MARASWVCVTVLAIALAIWFYADNRALRRELASRPAPPAPQVASAEAKTPEDPWIAASSARPAMAPAHASTPAPSLAPEPVESRLDRRQRNQAEFAAMFGRGSGETDDEYRARIMPLIKTGLAIPRQRVEEMRKLAEEKAHVTAQQSKQLDHAFDKTYADALAYTNKAIADGELSPYERNVAGWLDYAGGLGTILGDANQQIGQILSPDQMRTMSESGFEWGEYLGFTAPWENLQPPPAHK